MFLLCHLFPVQVFYLWVRWHVHELGYSVPHVFILLVSGSSSSMGQKKIMHKMFLRGASCCDELNTNVGKEAINPHKYFCVEKFYCNMFWLMSEPSQSDEVLKESYVKCLVSFYTACVCCWVLNLWYHRHICPNLLHSKLYVCKIITDDFDMNNINPSSWEYRTMPVKSASGDVLLIFLDTCSD